ncbi:MAG: GWxTD domain-containing protein [Gemmatimonadaceae bacterium]
MTTITGLFRPLLLAALAAAFSGCAGSKPGLTTSRTLEVLPTDGALTDATRFYRAMGLASAHMPVSFVGKVSFFASPSPDTTIALVSVSIPTRSLTFAREGDVYRAQYAVQLRLNQAGGEVQRIDASEMVRVGNFRETTRTDESVIFQRYLRVPPGAYTFGFIVRDVGSTRTSADTLGVTVPRLGSGSVSSPLAVYQVQARQRLDSLPSALPSPRSTAVFGRDSSVVVYLEAYGDATVIPIRISVRNESGTMLWADTSNLGRRGGLLSGVVAIPVARLGVGVGYVLFTRLDTRDSSATPIFVSFGDELPVAPFEDMLMYLRFFAPPSRLAALRNAPPEQRAQLWIDFLRATDPDPVSPIHEGLRDYFGRIQVANDRFRAEGIAGWLSDRGMVYVSLGEPDEVAEQLVTVRDRRLGTASRVPVQIWVYRRHRTQLIFTDERQSGRWELTPESESQFRTLTSRLLAER